MQQSGSRSPTGGAALTTLFPSSVTRVAGGFLGGFTRNAFEAHLFGLDHEFGLLGETGFFGADGGFGSFDLALFLAFGALFSSFGARSQGGFVGRRCALELVEGDLAGFGRRFGAVGVIGEFECHMARSVAGVPFRCNIC